MNPQNCEIEQEFDYNNICELRHLVNVKFTTLIGSIPEIKLIEYLLSIATNLESGHSIAILFLTQFDS